MKNGDELFEEAQRLLAILVPLIATNESDEIDVPDDVLADVIVLLNKLAEGEP